MTDLNDQEREAIQAAQELVIQDTSKRGVEIGFLAAREYYRAALAARATTITAPDHPAEEWPEGSGPYEGAVLAAREEPGDAYGFRLRPWNTYGSAHDRPVVGFMYGWLYTDEMPKPCYPAREDTEQPDVTLPPATIGSRSTYRAILQALPAGRASALSPAELALIVSASKRTVLRHLAYGTEMGHIVMVPLRDPSLGRRYCAYYASTRDTEQDTER